jgi:hypothetical protein
MCRAVCAAASGATCLLRRRNRLASTVLVTRCFAVVGGVAVNRIRIVARRAGRSELFCRRCRRMLPDTDFYNYNQSTCRGCIVARNRERRAADPDTKTKRRKQAARERFRSEVGVQALGRVLTGVVQLFSEVADGSLTVPQAQAEVFDLAAQAIRDVEDRCGVEPGSGIDVLHQRKPLRNHRDSA